MYLSEFYRDLNTNLNMNVIPFYRNHYKQLMGYARI